MLFGNAGCPSFPVFRFSGKKFPFRIRAVGKSVAKRKIILETLAARVILAPVARRNATTPN
jgi:glutamine synthetase type III